jgi:16S rRNA (uracil1498-N3)-methyltransferase
MRIPRLFLDDDLAPGHEIELPRDRAHYLLHVLRLGPGARLVLFDGRQPLDFHAELISVGKRAARVRIHSVGNNRLESPLDSLLIQAVGKPESIDWLVQKTTELGLTRLRLFNAERTQTPLRGARLDKKLTHWRAVAASACEQCGRSRLPAIGFADDLSSALAEDESGTRLLLDFDGQTLPALLNEGSAAAVTSASILIGPEGGLNEREISLAREAGHAGWRLGPRVLRMETAAVVALGLLQQALGDG